MDKNRVVTFGTLGGQSAPSSLSNVVNTGGYNLKGYCSTANNTNYLKYLYYGYAVENTDGRCFVPVFNTNDTTFCYRSNLPNSGQFSLMLLLESIAVHSGDPFYIQYSEIAGLSENSPKIDVFTLFEKDENGEFVEALDKNGDPIYYAEEHIDNDLNS